MKVSANQTNSQVSAKPSKSEVEAKIKAKFGKDFVKQEVALQVKDEPAAVVALSSKPQGVKNSSEADFGDIKNNDPNSPETQEKLKGLLKSGGFNFSDREREVLSQILK